MNRKRILVVTAVLLVMAFIIYSSMETAVVSCEVCIEFQGKTQCRKASGATREEAVRTATTSACATLTVGMTESIQCEGTRPKSITCRTL